MRGGGGSCGAQVSEIEGVTDTASALASSPVKNARPAFFSRARAWIFPELSRTFGARPLIIQCVVFCSQKNKSAGREKPSLHHFSCNNR